MDFKAPAQGTIGLIVITAVITSIVVGVFGKRLAEMALDWLLKPFTFVADALYRWLAPIQGHFGQPFAEHPNDDADHCGDHDQTNRRWGVRQEVGRNGPRFGRAHV